MPRSTIDCRSDHRLFGSGSTGTAWGVAGFGHPSFAHPGAFGHPFAFFGAIMPD